MAKKNGGIFSDPFDWTMTTASMTTALTAMTAMVLTTVMTASI